jgi:hypothetical protein
VQNSLIFLVFVFFTQAAWPQVKSRANKALKAVILSEQAYVFKKPDFDSEVITILSPGNMVYYVSSGKWDLFHKIRVSATAFGYISEADIKIISDQPRVPEEKQSEPQKPQKPFLSRSLIGPVIQMTNFTESTMAATRSQNLSFIGAKWSGISGFLEGAGYADSNLLFYSGAPGYYADATGKSAGGIIIIGDYMLEMMKLQGPDIVTFYGFGPMFRFSNLQVTLDQGNDIAYTMTDLVLGAVANAGAGVRLGNYALRFDGKYYWEKQKYWAIGLAFQWDL